VRMVRTRRCANQRETCSGVQPGIVEAYLFRTIRIRVTHGHTQRERHTHTQRKSVCVTERHRDREAIQIGCWEKVHLA
jgi:hypothetical protein